MKTIAVKDVAVRFGEVEALAGVSLEFAAGEVHLLAGPNGAGKSTLLHTLLGLVRPDRGGLWVDGQSRSVDNAFKEQLAYLPEAVSFADNLTGRQILRFFARARGCDRERVDVVLERVGLLDAGDRAIRGYSRGMRQRLGLAVALLPEADLLILDEPTGGLDQQGLHVLWEVLGSCREEGRTVLISSHDLTLLESRVDQICLLQDGRLVAHDSPERLRRQAALPVHVVFDLDDSPEAKVLGKAAQSAFGEASCSLDERRLTIDIAADQLLEVLDLRESHSGAVERVRVKEPGLDTVYEHLLANCGGV
ncbi:MAG: ABC transporter ATP-binding protein [Persicimonas sp.]